VLKVADEVKKTDGYYVDIEIFMEVKNGNNLLNIV